MINKKKSQVQGLTLMKSPSRAYMRCLKTHTLPAQTKRADWRKNPSLGGQLVVVKVYKAKRDMLSFILNS